MEKQKRWQLFLIIAVILLTIYNILPTVFYYTKPLKSPINEKRASEVSHHIVDRINGLEKENIEWIQSFCKTLKVKPLSINFDKSSPHFISIAFKTTEDAGKFREYLPRAGSLISFVPAQLNLTEEPGQELSKTVIVRRRIPVHFDPAQVNAFFQFSPKTDSKGQVTELYRSLVNDRALQLGAVLGGPSENAMLLNSALKNINNGQSQEALFALSQNLLSFVKLFGESSALSQRYFASFTQIESSNRAHMVDNFIGALDHMKDRLKLEKISLQDEAKNLQSQNGFLSTEKQQRMEYLSSREHLLTATADIVRKNAQSFANGKAPLTFATFGSLLQESAHNLKPSDTLQVISLNGRNPFIDKITIDWRNEKIYLQPQADLLSLKKKAEQNILTNVNYSKQLDQFLYDTLAGLSRQSGETITPAKDEFEISLSALAESKSFLAMRLSKIAEAEAKDLKNIILTTWKPQHRELQRDVFPIWDYETYSSLPLEQQKLGIAVYAPAMYSKIPPKGLRMNSIYVIAKGLDKILQKVRSSPSSESSKQFMADFQQLKEILDKNGFLGYSGSSFALDNEFASDFIFESSDYYQTVLNASYENFKVHGTKRYAVLEFSDVEQRILTENKIGTRMHEDLMKWADDYRSAQLKMKGTTPYDVPAPTKNVLWDNFKLSCVKYFRGDDRKILHWGLDLSGGKTVQIELRDHNGALVKDEADIKQAINELYNRVNKMGVSEVSIRQEGNYITLDFPGSQGLSAAELIKASSMYFHIVNEKFTPNNPNLSDQVGRFLQEVWNEAVITNRKEAEDINQIAWQHLYGESGQESAVPRSESAKVLYENGLRLANPQDMSAGSNYNDSISKVALLRGSDYTDWHGQTHPLLIVFRNYALEGANLDEVHASYDPSRGNYLAFKVKGSQVAKSGQKFNARDELYAWTSHFAKEAVTGTPNENYSRHHGWRMAVILNGTIISSPTLDSALRDSAMITGSFTQREVNQLEADLKAGSLSFTPRILSEKNVSPELGAHERTLGILATVLALILVIAAMVGYYKFAGVVACAAVLLNLLIMWATLQNLGATLTLATIAGIILTLGMAVDANVLVFERVREEFAVSGRIASAIHTGYKKAFSAIIDSNLTTAIAALVLLNFDSGPIKGFAITLLIGIASSMFTALFLTRYFFAGWIQNPEHKQLSMLNFLKATKINFLKYTKITMIISSVIIFAGTLFIYSQRHSMFGMDFTGGYALTLELQPTQDGNYREKVEKALIAQGASAQEFQIRELTPSNHIRLFLSKNLMQEGRPFYGMPVAIENKEATYLYENNPKIVWIAGALQKAHLSLTPQSLEHLDANWTEVSGQMSDTMRYAAMAGLIIALACIMLYITFRFEFKYAISATICLAHDLVFTVATMAILHFLGVPVQLDLITITALLTIIGYSLNDTIIVFDRIREDIRLMRKSSFSDIINHALNVTLSRTLMTSGTTLLVLIPLVILGGSTIFGFALVMIIGVVFGTLSSLFIAAPLMQYFHQRDLRKREKILITE